METNDESQEEPTIGFLLIFSEIISNEQIEKCFQHLKKSLKQIDLRQFKKLDDLLNCFISGSRFQPDFEFRQIENIADGSTVGFLYRPSFHTVLNVIEEYFQNCSIVSTIFAGQQIFPSGDFLLSDAIFGPKHISQLFQGKKSFRIENFQLVVPFVSNKWKILEKYFRKFQLEQSSDEIGGGEHFGRIFYEKLVRVLTEGNFNFDVGEKLIPRPNSGTIAFDQPTLYVFYGQQGEASLFGVRGFVVLINSGFSRFPSFWNLIRGLETVDACLLTHFDFDVLPGLQSLLCRKRIPFSDDGELCKPEITAMFINQTQQKKISAQPTTSESPLLVSLNDTINQVLDDLKKLNIETQDLSRNSTTNKSNVEPINLFKKVAFGSLDLYVLHPTSSTNENDKILMDLEKLKIGENQSNSSSIPLEHWYSACCLLVWTPSSKSNKEKPVRILYTGCSPQTLIFRSLDRIQHLDILRRSQTKPKEDLHKNDSSLGKTTNLKSSSSNEKSKTTTNKNISSISTKNETKLSKPNKEIEKNSTTPLLNKAKQIDSTKKILTKNLRISNKETTTQKEKEKVKVTKPARRSTSIGKSSPKIEEKKENPGQQSTNNEIVEIEQQVEDNNLVEELNLNENHEENEEKHDSTSTLKENSDLDEIHPEENEIEIVDRQIEISSEEKTETIDENEVKGLPIGGKTSSNSPTRREKTSKSENEKKKKVGETLDDSIFVEVAFVPRQGDENYVDREFFRRVRARFYVLNGVDLNRQVFDSILEGKKYWPNNEPTTIVPTFDGEILRRFFVENRVRLAELNIEILAPSMRCQVQCENGISAAQRLVFSSNTK